MVFKNVNKGSWQGADRQKSGAYKRGLKPLPQLSMILLDYHVHFHNNWWERHLAAILEHFGSDRNTAIW
jgi:hypothetical protein